ncbi:hypothetical protein GCM10020254_38700 [Streptomyces goshikiensis]
MIREIEVSGPGFLNITVSDRAIIETLAARAGDDRLGVPFSPNAGTTVIDYAQPNVAKEMHVGHLRSAVIGAAMVEILEFTGEKVVRRHHIGDWGTQFGMLIQFLIEHPHELDHKAAGAEADIEVSGEEAMSNLNRLYKASRALFDSDEEFKTRARARVVDLQAGGTRRPSPCGSGSSTSRRSTSTRSSTSWTWTSRTRTWSVSPATTTC